MQDSGGSGNAVDINDYKNENALTSGRLFTSKGGDGVSRMDKQRRMGGYNRSDFLIEKFINQRRKQEMLQLRHEHILDVGELVLRKLEIQTRVGSAKNVEDKVQIEMDRLQKEAEKFKVELKTLFMRKFEEEKEAMKQGYESQMQRIEKMRDELEEERVRKVVRKMGIECDLALKKQWDMAEENRLNDLRQLRDEMNRKAQENIKDLHQEAIKEAVIQAEANFARREQESILRTKQECEREYSEKLRQVHESYRVQIADLTKKATEADERRRVETNARVKIEDDFRLLQTDYKRFMNYTDHYNSDYMLKLRHIGAQILEDEEFEKRLNEQLETVDIKKIVARKSSSRAIKK